MHISVRLKTNIMIVIMMILIALTMTFTLSSCGALGRFSARQVGDGDGMIIPPDSTNTGSILSNQRNIDNSSNTYQQSVYNYSYQEVTSHGDCIDFDVDETRICMIQHDAATGKDAIVIRNIDDLQPDSGFIVGVNDSISTITVRSDVLYAYAPLDGDVLIYRITGNGNTAVSLVETAGTGLTGFDAGKMKVDASDRLYLLGTDESAASVLFTMKLNDPGSGVFIEGLPDTVIQDFCLMGDKSVLLRLYPERLGLYDIVAGKMTEISYLPDSARFIEYGSNILYYASGIKLGISNQSVVNASNEGSQGILGRLLLDNDFTWSIDPSSLADLKLGDIVIPFWNEEYRHDKMRQNNKYIFFLDHMISMGDPEAGTMLYRIAK